MKKICVFCGASDGVDKKYYEDAEKMGELLAKNGFDLVYGGSAFGLMGTIARSVNHFGAKVYGIIPKKLNDIVKHDNFYTELIVTNDMRERKDKMDKLSDGIITLAGGFGTLEEVSEMIVQKILGYNNKPIVLLNTNGFYDNLIKFFNQIISERFALEHASSYYFVAQNPQEALDYLKNYKPNALPSSIEEIYVKN